MPDPEQRRREDFSRSGGSASQRTEAAGDGLLSRLGHALFGWKNGPTRADLGEVIDAAGGVEDGITAAEQTMLRNVLALRETRIEDAMVPRADIVAVRSDISLGELVRVFEKAGHSRLVVFAESLDDPSGMVHLRDLIAFLAERAHVDPAKVTRRRKAFPADLDLRGIDLAMSLSETQIVREVLFVPPSMPALDLLAKMQASHIHLAVVVDEYGGTDGLVSIEDIVEEIVGDIEDEHDEEETPHVVPQPDGSFIADARASLDDVAEAIGVTFEADEIAREVDTIAGYVMAKAGRLPPSGARVIGPGQIEIEVLDADPRRIKTLRIHRAGEQSGAFDRSPSEPSSPDVDGAAGRTAAKPRP